MMLVGPGTVLTQNRDGTVIEEGALLLDGDTIVAVGPYDALATAHPGARRLDAANRLIMPGLINAHGHFYGTFARGMALKDPAPETFQQVLERLWWRLDKALTPEGVYLSALLGAIAAIRSGTTTVIDHHASPRAVTGSLGEVATAMREVGLRGCLCYEVSDRDGPEIAQAGIDENRRFLEEAAADPLIRGKFGLHASFTCSTETLINARQAEAEAGGAGFHIHCAEGPEDGRDARARYGKSPVERLAETGILGPRTIVAHCVHVDEDDIETLAFTGTTVSHQPQSNMGNAVGWARILAMRERGVRVALGTDGYGQDMFESWKAAATLHSHMTGRPGTGVGEFGHVLLQENSRLASDMFGRPVGQLVAGAAADLILVDYQPPTPLTAGNQAYHLYFGANASLVDTVIIHGRVVMAGRQLVGIDEAAVAAEARRVAAATWERF